MRQSGGETEMRERKIPVGLDGTTKPRDRILIAPHIEFGEPREIYSDIGVRIARTEAERLLDMGLGFLAATDEIHGLTDHCVGVCQISIQRQSLLTMSI
jgi:hypothetical protein